MIIDFCFSAKFCVIIIAEVKTISPKVMKQQVQAEKKAGRVNWPTNMVLTTLPLLLAMINTEKKLWQVCCAFVFEL